MHLVESLLLLHRINRINRHGADRFFFVIRTLRTLLLVGFRIKADPFLSPRHVGRVFDLSRFFVLVDSSSILRSVSLLL